MLLNSGVTYQASLSGSVNYETTDGIGILMTIAYRMRINKTIYIPTILELKTTVEQAKKVAA